VILKEQQMNKFSYSEVNKSFNNMTLRERFILFGALIICSVSITYFWILEPVTIKQTILKVSLKKSMQEEKVIAKEISEVKLRLQQDPLEEINNKIAFSQASLMRLDKQLDEKLVKFIHAQKMPIALTKVLTKTPGVKISGLKSLSVKTFNTDKHSNDTPEQSVFYQHTLQVNLVGDYNAIYQYLLNVENLQDKFYWYSIDYKVSDYPLAEVILQIYTLSDQQDLISG
jgi:MSHA biogenesis protein MshJ